MRTQNTLWASFAATLIMSASAFAGLSDVVYFNFAGWDQDLIVNGGQTFTDIYEDIDVTVTPLGTGMFDGTPGSKFTGGLIRTKHVDPGAHTFRFTFSEPLRLVIKTETIDPKESVTISTSSTETYFHESGAPPTITPSMSGISITGNGFRVAPNGSAFGETLTGEASVLTVSYRAMNNVMTKYNQFAIGTLVPEPNAIALLGIGGLGMLLQLRKRNKK